MYIAIYFIVAILAYFIAGLNFSIIFSKAIYHRDIRNEGSGNPGFTNFKRVFGNKYAWFVFFLDILKTVVISLAAGFLFKYFMHPFLEVDPWDFGVAYSCIFAMIGNAFPALYKFKGGKGFLVCYTTIWFLDWRTGLITTGIFLLLLFTIKFMSLSTMLALTLGDLTLLIWKTHYLVIIMYALCVIFMIIRHHENIKRLFQGTESKFSLRKKKDKESNQEKVQTNEEK